MRICIRIAIVVLCFGVGLLAWYVTGAEANAAHPTVVPANHKVPGQKKKDLIGPIGNVSFANGSLFGGSSTTAYLHANATSPSARVFDLSSSDSAVAWPDAATATIPANVYDSNVFGVSTSDVGATRDVTITGTLQTDPSKTISGTITVFPL